MSGRVIRYAVYDPLQQQMCLSYKLRVLFLLFLFGALLLTAITATNTVP
jgi:hypothetical protein